MKIHKKAESKRWKMIYRIIISIKKQSLWISDKLYFNTKYITRDKGDYFMIYQEQKQIQNMHKPNYRTQKFMKQKLTQLTGGIG